MRSSTNRESQSLRHRFNRASGIHMLYEPHLIEKYQYWSRLLMVRGQPRTHRLRHIIVALDHIATASIAAALYLRGLVLHVVGGAAAKTATSS